MTLNPPVYVLDTGPLSHFARSQWLGVLKAILGDTRAVIPDVVHNELRNGCGLHYHLQAVLDASWIDVVALDTPARLEAFAHYEQRLVGPDGRNIGECGVLALAETLPNATAVIDDRVAVQAGEKHKVKVRRTLGLLCDAIRQEILTVPWSPPSRTTSSRTPTAPVRPRRIRPVGGATGADLNR